MTAPAVVVSSDITVAEALALALRRRDCDARPCVPGALTEVEPVTGVLVIVPSDCQNVLGAQVKGMIGVCTTRVVVFGRGSDFQPDGVPVDAWLGLDVSLDEFARSVAVIDAGINGRSNGPSRRHRGLDRLTPREREVLTELLAGHGTAALARRLAISEHTVRTHMQNVLTKLGLHSHAEATAWAIREGIVPTGAHERLSR